MFSTAMPNDASVAQANTSEEDPAALVEKKFDCLIADEETDMAKMCLNIGAVFYSHGDSRSAIVKYQEALSVADQMNHPLLADIFNNLALANAALNQFDEAIYNARRALSLRCNDDTESAKILINIGNILIKMKNRTGAMAAYREALNMMINTLDKDHEYVIDARNNIASCLAELGDFDGAMKEFEDLLDKDEDVTENAKICEYNRNSGVSIDEVSIDESSEKFLDFRKSLLVEPAEDVPGKTLNSRMGELLNLLDNCEDDMRILREILGASPSSRDRTQSIDRLQVRMNKLEGDIHARDKKIKELETNLQDAQSMIKELQDTVNCLKSLQAKNDEEYSQNISLLQMQNEEQQTKLTHLANELNIAKTHDLIRDEELVSHEESHRIATEMLNKTIRTLEEALVKKEEEYSKANAVIRGVHEQALLKLRQQLEAQIMEAENQRATHATCISQFNETIEKSTLENSRIGIAADQMKGELTIMQRALVDMAKAKEEKDKLDSATLNKAQEQVASLHSMVLEGHSKATDLLESYNQVREELHDSKTRACQLAKEKEAMETELDHLRKINGSVQTQIQEELKTRDKAMAHLEAKFESNNQQICRLKSVISHQEKDMAARLQALKQETDADFSRKISVVEDEKRASMNMCLGMLKAHSQEFEFIKDVSSSLGSIMENSKRVESAILQLETILDIDAELKDQTIDEPEDETQIEDECYVETVSNTEQKQLMWWLIVLTYIICGARFIADPILKLARLPRNESTYFLAAALALVLAISIGGMYSAAQDLIL